MDIREINGISFLLQLTLFGPMKYFIILVASVLFFVGTATMAYFLWDVEEDWKWKAFMIFSPTLFCYVVIKNIQNYSKIQLNKNELLVSKVFSTHTFDLNDLTAWSEETNVYRVRFRRIELRFKKTKLTLIDHADPMNMEALYHYLRTHYGSRMVKPWVTQSEIGTQRGT